MKKILGVILGVGGLAVHAATFTVTNPNDSGAGSLRAAMLAANTTPGPNTIAFNLAGTNLQTIAPVTALPTLTNAVTLDGYTQPGSSANTLAAGDNARLLIRLDGSKLPVFTPLLKLTGSGHTVRGLIIVRAPAEGIDLVDCSSSTISGNWIGLDVDNLASGNGRFGGVYVTTSLGTSSGNLIGGTTPATRNVIAGNSYGIYLFPGSVSGNQIQGNFIGTDATGTLNRGNNYSGIYVQAGINNLIGGATAAARNIISGNGQTSSGNGIYLLGGTATVVQNNFIGTDVTGNYDLGNGAYGIGIQNSSISGCQITGNLIANNRSHGIYVLGASTNSITGNLIGTDSTGTRQMGNAGAGIYFFSGSQNSVGGSAASANTIRFNTVAGVEIDPTGGGTNISIRANLISDNRGPAITNLVPVYLAITNAVNNGGGNMQLAGTLTGAPSGATFTVDFYAAASPSLFGYPQAQQYLGFTTVNTDATGAGSFNVTLPVAVPAGWMVNGTTTDAGQNTSMLSPAVATIYAAQPALSIASTVVTAGSAQVISWPSSNALYQLQTTWSLTNPIVWQSVTSGILDNGTVKSYSVTNRPPVTNQFFRLKM